MKKTMFGVIVSAVVCGLFFLLTNHTIADEKIGDYQISVEKPTGKMVVYDNNGNILLEVGLQFHIEGISSGDVHWDTTSILGEPEIKINRSEDELNLVSSGIIRGAFWKNNGIVKLELPNEGKLLKFEFKMLINKKNEINILFNYKWLTTLKYDLAQFFMRIPIGLCKGKKVGLLVGGEEKVQDICDEVNSDTKPVLQKLIGEKAVVQTIAGNFEFVPDNKHKVSILDTRTWGESNIQLGFPIASVYPKEEKTAGQKETLEILIKKR